MLDTSKPFSYRNGTKPTSVSVFIGDGPARYVSSRIPSGSVSTMIRHLSDGTACHANGQPYNDPIMREYDLVNCGPLDCGDANKIHAVASPHGAISLTPSIANARLAAGRTNSQIIRLAGTIVE